MKRYVLDSVTGFHITPGAASPSRSPRTLWVVLDSAIGYHTVAQFLGQNAAIRAHELAEELNDDNDHYLESLA